MATSEDATINHRFGRLEELVALSKKNANQYGERFNIFSILGLQRDEARTHSRYLAELLNPTGRHGEGTSFLRIFVQDILKLSYDIQEPIKVKRELKTEDQRRVDIVIESPNLIIGIEVKIDAGDQKAQLRDYYRELIHRSRDRKAVLVYLTLDGKPPSAYSLRDLEKENVHCLSFAKDIRQWVDHCAGLYENKPELKFALIQYKRLLEDLTGLGTSMTSLIGKKLACNRDDLETALHIEKALPAAKTAVMLQFWEGLSDALTEALRETPVIYGGKNLHEISKNYFHSSRGAKHVGIKYKIAELNDEERICLYVNVYNAVHYGLRIDDKSGSPISLQHETKAKLLQKLITLSPGNAVADKNADWLVCYYHAPSSDQEPVVLNFDSFGDPVLDLLDESNRQAIIQNMVEHQVSLIEAAKLLIESTEA